MRRILVVASVCALAVARPELYREKEDFQYSRSSSDEGSKAGFYGAQRGNMGGNYERAHNMDTLAQHQMSGLVRQVDGELGDGAKTRTGSVYSAANSRGIYGSGKYDLSNLEGRNFQEGTTYGDSQSRDLSYSHKSGYNARSSSDSSAAYSSSHAQNSRHHSAYNGYQSGTYSGQDSLARNLYTTDNLQAARNYDYGGRDSLGYYSSNGYHGSNSNTRGSSSSLQDAAGYGSDSQTRIISAMPVRVIVRPGGRVAIPIAAQSYDSARTDSSFEQNAIGGEAEILTDRNSQTNIRPDNAKHYESSYRYQKEWEKHDTVPVILPTGTSYPKNSELYEDNQASTPGFKGHSYDASRQSASNTLPNKALNGYASSSQTRHHHSSYNTEHESSASGSQYEGSSSTSNSNAYGLQAHTGGSAAALNLNNQFEDINSKPKSYQASYSYHKSWERQGDPYVIKPAMNDISQTSQKLTADNQYGSHYYGSHHHDSHTKSHQNYYGSNTDDCDDSDHIRVARSYDTRQNNQFFQEAQNLEELGQQSETQWGELENGQLTQKKWNDLEDLGQQKENTWEKQEDLAQQTQHKWNNLEDLGQQTQPGWNIENNEQQVQQNLENLGQQNEKFTQVAGQQTQEAFDNFDRSQYNRHELDLGQQLQDTWTTFEHGPQNPVTANTYQDQKNDKFIKQETHSDSQMQNAVNDHKLITEEPQVHGIPSIWGKEESIQQQGHQNYFHQNQGSSIFKSDSSNIEYEQNQQHEYHEVSSDNGYWSSNTASPKQDRSLESNVELAPLSTLWGKLDKIEEQWLNKLNKEFSNNRSEDAFVDKNSVQDNEFKNYNNNKDSRYNATVESKPTTSNGFSITNKTYDSSTLHKIQSSDIGRGDIGPDDLDNNQDNPTITSDVDSNVNNNGKPFQIGQGYLDTVINNTAIDMRINNRSDNYSDNLYYSHQKWFENENHYTNVFSEPKSTVATVKASSSSVDLSPEDMPESSGIIEQESKQEIEPQENLEKDKFSQQKDNIDKENVSQQESLDQQSFGNVESFSQQSDQFDQENISPRESFDQQSLGGLRQFSQQSDKFDQQNVNSQESFDKQSFGNLEQFSQQSNKFDQQNVNPQESFDQTSLDNLGQFSQQSEKYNQQNINPQESFDQQSLSNLEQFSQQSDKFDQQNVNSQESFDQTRSDNLGQFSQQSEKYDQQNINPQESFDQQSLGNLEQFSQQSDKFDQQNVNSQESFDQTSLDNLGQFSQQSDKFDQQNMNPQESLDQQSLGNLEQFSQQSENFDQQNVSQKESFDQQNANDDLVLPIFAKQNQPLKNIISSKRYSEIADSQKEPENFQQNSDELVIPLPVREKNKGQSSNQAVQSIYSQQESENTSLGISPLQEYATYNSQNQPHFQEKEGTENIEPNEKDEVLVTPPENVTEKPGFWKSVGNKFVSAKDKIASWFSRE